MTLHCVIALDTFKGSLTAAEATAALGAGLRDAGSATVELPVADGGEGTVDAVVAAGYGRIRRAVCGPTGEPVQASIAVRGYTAVVELAEAAGLQRLPGGRPAPLTATTYGAGELVRAALDAGTREVILAVGGSATVDGGAGLLQALGARLAPATGGPLGPGGGALRDLAAVDLSELDPRLRRVDVVLAADVDNPLLGPSGAAAVYGPQKGAGPADVAALDEGLARWATLLGAAAGRDVAAAPGAGAAGGAGFAALAALGAVRRPGIDVVLDVLELDDALAELAAEVAGGALVVVGEGSLDAQSLRGKAPVGVAARARAHGLPVVAVAGRVELTAAQLRAAGIDAAYALTDLAPDIETAIRTAPQLLRQLGGQLAARWAAEPKETLA
ncbi:glycerate kinase family protein [Spirilliplanes yamanashiensis]|nr:glycerate kinase [Spirilliplanes yamanashiensis]MDP9819052.1 glycerate kinase [Spirilliplanes yamanashiensis]